MINFNSLKGCCGNDSMITVARLFIFIVENLVKFFFIRKKTWGIGK